MLGKKKALVLGFYLLQVPLMHEELQFLGGSWQAHAVYNRDYFISVTGPRYFCFLLCCVRSLCLFSYPAFLPVHYFFVNQYKFPAYQDKPRLDVSTHVHLLFSCSLLSVTEFCNKSGIPTCSVYHPSIAYT